MAYPDPRTAALETGLVAELRQVRVELERIAELLVGDDHFVAAYLDQLQAFDLLGQTADEIAAVLERLADGMDADAAVERVRLDAMLGRLRDAMAGAGADAEPAPPRAGSLTMAAANGANQRPIVIRKIKKTAAGHHGGAWKVAYADFVTAMMAFFMLLWLISNPDKQRLKGLAEYFSPSTSTTMAQVSDQSASVSGVGGMPGAGGHTRRGQSDDTRSPAGQPAMEAGTAGVARGGTANVPDASLRVLAQEMKVMIDTMPPDGDGHRAYKIENDPAGLRISLMDSAGRSMFRDGTATLNPFARETLARVAAKLARSEVQIAIEGHTDSHGGGAGDDSGWHLSGERALAARAAMIGAGLAPSRFAEMVALADSRPVYPDQPDRPENRRVTIIAKGAAPTLPSDASFRF